MDDKIDALTVLGEQLIAAVFNRNSLDHIAELISTGAPVWYQNDAEGLSPLHAAVYVQDAALVKYLIEQGAVWNAGTCLFSTSIHSLIALKLTKWATRPETLRYRTTIPKSILSCGTRGFAQVMDRFL
jgi:ankyrin repeat protein